VSVICAADFEGLANSRLDAELRDFISGGSGAERTLNANRLAFEDVRFRTRVMVDVSGCEAGTTLLGAPLRAPVGLAPTAYHRLVHDDGELATAQGTAGALYIVGMFASRSLEEIAEVAAGPLWLQLYWLHDRKALIQLVERATVAGYRAIVLTVDTPRIGQRFRDLRNGFTVPAGVRAVNLDSEAMATTHQRRAGGSAIAAHAAEAFDASLNWDDVKWLRALTDLPLVLKGILTAEDATRAVESGVDALIVSNHGGRQLDGVPASLHALVEVVPAVRGACPVLLDGGIRSGSDVFAALALGADTVLIGRPALWALAVGGARGVARLLDLIHDELIQTMTLAGRPSVAAIDRSAVEFPLVPHRLTVHG
jgi:4-hydroxymandelate oxidase